MKKVFIDGKEGTTGLKIYEYLSERKDVELMFLPDEERKVVASRKKMINASDVTILCLPDSASVEAVSLVENDNTRIIDASTAHRTLADWAYGFPELDKALEKKIANGKRVAVPGCYASGFLAIVYPLIKSGLLPTDYPFVCYGISGYSGGGKKMIAQYTAGDRSAELDSPRQYALTQTHKHIKEMQLIAGLDGAPIFAPIVSDYPCGMETSVPLFASLFNKRVKKSNLCEFYKEYYNGKALVSVSDMIDSEISNGGFIASNAMTGSNGMQILIGGNDERFLPIAVYDNLRKGASGAAVECLNLMLGLDMSYGLI